MGLQKETGMVRVKRKLQKKRKDGKVIKNQFNLSIWR